MQTNLLLNALMSTPATGTSPQGGLLGMLMGAPATGTAGNQFTSLLGQPGKPSDLALLSTNNPTGDTGASPAQGIALPVLGTYIDQPNPIAPTKPNFAANSAVTLDAAKKLQAIANPAGNVAQASDVVNDQEFAAAVKNLENTKPEDGKIKLNDILHGEKTETPDDIMAKVAAHLNENTPAKKVETAQNNNAAEPAANATNTKTEATDTKGQQQGNELLNHFKEAAEGVKGKEGAKADEFKVSLDNAEVTGHSQSKLHELQNALKEIKIDGKTATTQHASAADQVQVKIAQMVKDGLDMIRIKLNPVELGQVDIQMDVSNDGSTSIRIMADRSETLDLLRRDSHYLEKALKDTGVKADTAGLQFSLREGGQQQQQFAGMNHGKHYSYNPETTSNYLKASGLTEQTYNLSLRPEGVNIFA